ncbi:ABC transporter permease [Microbacterium sp. KR10-403]|uniref:ABC transporter permease n=1 Tax=Microbacterium sp. KR10-403 TaxID=3158581 RepID=UPI0032E5184E
MNFAGIIRLSLSRIWANKTRSALTILGVVIGVGALVGLVSIVQSASTGISSSLNSLGGNNVSISASAGGTLTDGDAEALEGIDGVAAVATGVTTQGTATHGSTSATFTIQGVSADYPATTSIDLAAGSFLPEGASLRATRSVVLDADAADSLGLSANDVGAAITLEGRTFTVVGVLQAQTGFAGFGGSSVYITQEAARTMFAPAPDVSSITVVTTSDADVDGLVDSVTRVLLERHDISDADDADFTVTNQADILDSLNSVMGILQLLLGGIASISLLVGGIGIMNIMLVSVRERTREIGVRRAIGAKRRTILAQFLVEAVVLSVIGGILGIGLGALIAWVVSLIGGLTFAIAGWVVVVGLVFSALVGIVFGVGPARTAARMAPVEALRYE